MKTLAAESRQTVTLAESALFSPMSSYKVFAELPELGGSNVFGIRRILYVLDASAFY